MSYSRVILMGDPTCFRIKHGANPHTRNRWGLKKRVNRSKAKDQWHAMAETLIEHGVQIYVIPAHPGLPGLVFPANAGFLLRPEKALPLSQREYIRSNLNVLRRPEQAVYEEFLQSLGVKVHDIARQFEGEADLIPWQDYFLYTYGPIERQRFVFQWDWPPWRRVYGFRSGERTCIDLDPWVPLERIISLKLLDEAYYHGDTVLCSIGPKREYLLVYAGGLTAESLQYFVVDPHVIWLSEQDARQFAANSFQVVNDGQCKLFMPAGVSEELRRQIERRGIETILIDVSEFFEKGGGSVKCMIGDLGAWAEDENIPETVRQFRKKRIYQNM